MRQRRRGATFAVALLLAVRAAADPLVVDAAQRDRMALLSAPVARGFDAGDVAAFGHVLDPQPLVDAALARAAANSIAERSEREVARVRKLNRGAENASARELEVAEDADRRARLDAEAAQSRFAGTWGAALAERDDLSVLLTEVRRGHLGIARIDVPAGVDALTGPSGLRVAIATRPERTLAARIVGPAPVVDPNLQGNGWFVLIEAPPPVGTALAATLRFAERSFEGVVIPRSAVVRQDGRAYVYVEAPAGSFQRHLVSLLRPRDDGWLATGMLTADDLVVVRGAQQLLATERARRETN